LKKRQGVPINVDVQEEPPTQPGEFPRLYIDEQIYSIGVLGYEELVNVLDKCIENKHRLVNKKVKELQDKLKEYDWAICYSTPILKHSRLEIIVPITSIYVGKQGFTTVIQVMDRDREAKPNTLGAQNAIMELGQKIFDLRNLDSPQPKEYTIIGRHTEQIYLR